ncbi:GNAT family N-acetyltransferase [Microbacterium pseudoresistens]|uniref:GNAT superfamily N-acetyltransferase n=1 Tax=Microbacterium pseudoresistens TaxID=640634 RepID=A0A7Y9EUZ0_9MICO|nr:GNAT family N-acetyltransferase [Microbacterium pseudoresistens]NYD54435.1 GNAT superfamily N-acetyltransferase [Microbacterium pseudoresistens]
MLIREATVDDAHGIAVVHVRSWQAAYRGLMPQAVLDDLSVTQREEGWLRILSGDAPDGAAAHRGRTIVAERERRILGWASFGEARDADAPAGAELWGVYAHPEAYGQGAGHALITAVEAAFRAEGHASAYLWVLAGNARAETFYQRHGWLEDGGVKVDERPGLRLRERRRVRRLA